MILVFEIIIENGIVTRIYALFAGAMSIANVVFLLVPKNRA